MRESAGRNKGREEGDVRTIRQGGMDVVDCNCEPAVLVENFCILP
jgi:hypothetical protein